MRALVVAPNWIGDAVMAQPLLARLKSDQPERALDWLAPAHILAVGQAIPEVDRLIEAPQRHGKLDLTRRWQLAHRLRRESYAQAFILPNSAKSALIPWLAQIPVRIGYRGEMRTLLLTHRCEASVGGYRAPMIEHYLRLARVAPPPSSAERKASAAPEARPRLIAEDATARTVRARFALSDDPLLVLAPGAEFGPAKRWPTRHFAALADQLSEAWPRAQVVLVGSMADRPTATEILAMAARPVRNLCGETTLSEVFALIANADGVVSNDSGLMHVAAAFGRPQVAVFGSSDPRHTPPSSPQAQVRWLQLACSPCFERQCPLGHTACLSQITPTSVFNALNQTMARQG